MKRSRPGARLLATHKVHKRTTELACLGWCVRVEAAGPSVILTALSQYFTMKWQQSVARTDKHTHTFKVVMRVSNTNYNANMLANKFRRTTFATSFDYHHNLSA